MTVFLDGLHGNRHRRCWLESWRDDISNQGALQQTAESRGPERQVGDFTKGCRPSDRGRSDQWSSSGGESCRMRRTIHMRDPLPVPETAATLARPFMGWSAAVARSIDKGSADAIRMVAFSYPIAWAFALRAAISVASARPRTIALAAARLPVRSGAPAPCRRASPPRPSRH